VKEAASRNRVEHNRCAGSDDPDGAGFSSRGDRTTFRANISTRHAGAGIRLGGDRPTQGLRNSVVGNILADNAGYGLKVLRSPRAGSRPTPSPATGGDARTTGRSPSATPPPPISDYAVLPTAGARSGRI
jgi:hypothetical protein